MLNCKLTEAPKNVQLIIVDVFEGEQIRHRLNKMGIHHGDGLMKLNLTNWGPVLVQNLSGNSGRIALGRGLAEKIIVEVKS